MERGPAGGLWPFVARDDELAQIVETERGAVLAGEAGIGKSRLLAEALDRVSTGARGRVVRIAATESLGAVPFGAFAGALAKDLEAGSSTDMLSRAVRALAGDHSLADVTLAIDDAHLLDDASAGVALVAAQSGAQVFATVRTRQPCPDAVTRLWKDDFIRRIDVRPIDERGVGRLLEAALGDPLDERSRHRLFNVTGGNLLFLRELVRHAYESGALTRRGGLWTWHESGTVAPGVLDLVEDRLRRVSDAVRDVIEVLAVAEPLGRAVVEAACSPEARRDAEAAGLVTTMGSGARDDLRLVHPLYAQVVRSGMTPGRRAGIAGRTAACLVETGHRRRDDHLRVALMRLEAGQADDPRQLEAAAREAGSRGDLVLAGRFARAAVKAGGGVESTLLLGDVLYWSGRHEELIALLDGDLGPKASSAQVARAAVLASSAWYWGLGNFEEADARIEKGLAVVDSGHDRLLRAHRAEVLMYAGRTSESIEVGRTVLADPDASVDERLRAYSGVLVSEAQAGHFGAVEAELPAAMALVMEAGPDLSVFHADGVMVATFVVRMFSAGLDEIDALVGALHADALGRAADPYVGVWSCVLGRSALAQGRLAEAIARLRDAASLLRAQDPGGTLPWALAALAQALGATDDGAKAAEAVQEMLQVRTETMHHIDIEIELGQAWAASARGERSLGRRIALEIGRSLMDDGRVLLGAFAFHEALRLGAEPEMVIGGLDIAAAACDVKLLRIFARHVHGLLDADYDALLRTADEFEASGWMLHAAECAASASRVAADKGLRVRQRDAAVRSAALAAHCGPALTPMLETVAGKQALALLTRREQEVALLAARGMSKREIADALFLSARTVGNHINHVYAKMGIGSRAELGIALGIADAH